MNSLAPNRSQTPASLEEIRQLKAQTFAELQQQKEAVSKSVRKLVAPLAPAVTKGNSLMRAFNTGIMAFDGVMLGVKLIRKLQKASRLFRRY